MTRKNFRYEQLTFARLLGGRRKGAGRKKSPDSGVPHLRRAPVSIRQAVHVTVRVREDVPHLRQLHVLGVFHRCFEVARERPGRKDSGLFRLVHYSIQGNHIHLLVQASDRDTLTRALIGLLGRSAMALNKLFGRCGEVFADRYHDRVLSTPREIYNVLRYLFENARKHGMSLIKGRPDPYSSGLWFDGWKDYVHDGWIRRESPVARAVGWLLNKGWRRYGLLELRPAWDHSLNWR